MDWDGFGSFLVGVSAFGVMIGNMIWAHRSEKRAQARFEAEEVRMQKMANDIGDVKEATNGMSHELQEFSRKAGFAAGHDAAEKEREKKSES